MISIDHITPIPAKSLAEIQERNECALKAAEDPACSLDQAEFDRAMLGAEVERLHRGMRDLYARWIQRAHDNGDYYDRTAAKYECGKAVAFDAAAEEIRLLIGEEAVKGAAEASQAEQERQP